MATLSPRFSFSNMAAPIPAVAILGSLSSDVFERRTSTGSDPFSLLVSLYATVFVLPSVLIQYRDDLPKNLFKITAQECKKSISG